MAMAMASGQPDDMLAYRNGGIPRKLQVPMYVIFPQPIILVQ
jgi:hypothetical protein